MLPEEVFYLFLFPWILLIASVPGLVMTFLFSGIAATLTEYLPSKSNDQA